MASILSRLADTRVLVAAAHVFATVRTGKVHRVALGGGDELADVVEPLGRQPLLAASALDGEAVGRLLVWTAELVAALVRVDPHLYGSRDARHQFGIENQEARVGGAIIVELAVNDGRTLAADHGLTVEVQLPGSHD